MEWLHAEMWSPYVVGAALGVLSWFTFLLSDQTLGCSTSFARFSGMIEKLFRGKAVEEMPYYKKTAPKVDWQVMLVIGVVIGAFLSSQLSGTFRFEMVTPLWTATFGDTPFLRFLFALAGGILMGIGSRWANGCTSGHGISGALQMAASGWVSIIFFFAGGIVVSFLLYG